MTSLSELTDVLRPFLASNTTNTKSLKFDLKGEGFLYICGVTVNNKDSPVDCTILVSLADLERISKGDLDPAEAFQQGKLRIDGDMSVAMSLQPFFSRAWAHDV